MTWKFVVSACFEQMMELVASACACCKIRFAAPSNDYWEVLKADSKGDLIFPVSYGGDTEPIRCQRRLTFSLSCAIYFAPKMWDGTVL